MAENAAKAAANDVKYVYLELVKAAGAGNYDVVPGLLKMMLNHDGNDYICLHSIKNSTALMNLKFYNIMTVEYMDSDFKHLAYATLEADDQEEAFGMVKELYEGLCEAGFSLGKESIVDQEVDVIDIAKYSGYPDNYLEGAKVEKDKLVTSGTSTQKPAHQRYARNSGVVGFVKTPTKPDPEPSLMGRTKAEKPSAEVLAAIREKIDGVKAGTYSPELPETIEGEVDTYVDDYDREYGYFC